MFQKTGERNLVQTVRLINITLQSEKFGDIYSKVSVKVQHHQIIDRDK